MGRRIKNLKTYETPDICFSFMFIESNFSLNYDTYDLPHLRKHPKYGVGWWYGESILRGALDFSRNFMATYDQVDPKVYLGSINSITSKMLRIQDRMTLNSDTLPYDNDDANASKAKFYLGMYTANVVAAFVGHSFISDGYPSIYFNSFIMPDKFKGLYPSSSFRVVAKS